MPTPDEVHERLSYLIWKVWTDWMERTGKRPQLVLTITLPMHFLWLKADAFIYFKNCFYEDPLAEYTFEDVLVRVVNPPQNQIHAVLMVYPEAA